jgi:predicted RNase H-like HicB family nuclease
MATAKLKVEIEQEKDGRWIAEIRELPGCMTYGKTIDEALEKVKTLALRVMAEGKGDWTIKKQHSALRQILSAIKLAQSKYIFSNGEKIGPRMLARISKRTGLKPENL